MSEVFNFSYLTVTIESRIIMMLLCCITFFSCKEDVEIVKQPLPSPTTPVVKTGKIETMSVYSIAMKRDIKTSVVLPNNYDGKKLLPVLYLLHGFDGDHKGLLNSIPELQALSDQYGFIIVCPDGGKSWYFDSPVDPTYKYETYIIQELLPEIDKNYSTIKDRKQRAIAGISMGGHGAMYLAIRHQNLFGAVGSICGGVDFRSFPEAWELKNRLGPKNQYPNNWEQNTVINMVSQLSPNSLEIIFDCGTEDAYFKEANRNFHEKLTSQGIDHKYVSQESGGHDYVYIRKAMVWQTKFFGDFFKK